MLVGPDLDARGARLFDMRDDVGRLAPDLWPQHLDVRHHAGNLRLARDGDDLLDRLDDADIVIALVADVAGVDRVRKWRPGPGEADALRHIARATGVERVCQYG